MIRLREGNRRLKTGDAEVVVVRDERASISARLPPGGVAGDSDWGSINVLTTPCQYLYASSFVVFANNLE